MGCINGDFVSDEEKAVSDSFSDLLLFTTMCIIGFPVDVHVKDGSIYSGTFYTACLDHDYAIVLKRAMMTKKGNRVANVPNGCLIDTLVIQAEDLVQVIAKDILLPAEGIPRKGGADDDCASAVTQEKATKIDELVTEHNYSNCASLPSRPIEGQARGSPEGDRRDLSAEPKFQIEQKIDEFEAFSSSVDACDAQPNLSTRNNEEAKEIKISNSSFEKSSGIKTNDIKLEKLSSDRIENPKLKRLSSDRIENPKLERLSSDRIENPAASALGSMLIPPKTAKEFNLNPKAKVFCPSSLMHRPATPPALATLANVTYVPVLCPVGPIASIEPEIDASSFYHRSSTPAKYFPQNNLIFGSGYGDHQYPQPVRAYVGSRTQPIRYATHYGHVQPGTAYMQPNSQNVMAGRWGPVVYVHPVSNEVVTHSSVRPSQGPAHSFNIPKHQATASMQMYMSPPAVVGNGLQQPLTMPGYIPNGLQQQPLTMPGYIPMSQTIGQVPVMGTFPVPGSDNSFITKFV